MWISGVIIAILSGFCGVASAGDLDKHRLKGVGWLFTDVED